MIVHDRFLFLHVPRTGGSSIEHVLRREFPEARAELTERRHAIAPEVRAEIGPDRYERAWKFLVMRSPWEIVESAYRRAAWLAHQPDCEAYEYEWPTLRRVGRMRFAEYVHSEWIDRLRPPAGHWRHFTRGDASITVFQFARLGVAWETIQNRLGFTADLPRLNHTRGQLLPEVRWTRPLIHGIARLFAEDVERFGYEPPET